MPVQLRMAGGVVGQIGTVGLNNRLGLGPAVYLDHLPVDKAALVGGQKGAGGGHLVPSAKPTNGNPIRHFRDVRGHGWIIAFTFDGTGGDDVCGDPLGPELLCERLGQAPYGVFGSGHMGAAVVAVDRVHPGEIDHPTPALVDHTGQASPGEPEGTHEIGVDDPMPLFVCHL